jgi:hypothetical protein
MKDDITNESELNPEVIWAEVRKVAARAPKWASTDPPYSVREESPRQRGAETKTQMGALLTQPEAQDTKSQHRRFPSFLHRIARAWKG